MIACLFNKGFSKEGCPTKAQSLEELLTHVRKEHGAIAWDIGTLQAALNGEKGGT